MYFNHDMGWWSYAGMGVGMVVFWSAVLFGIIVTVMYVFRDRPSMTPPSPQSPPAEEILAARFARGEIDETDYEQRIALLRAQSRR